MFEGKLKKRLTDKKSDVCFLENVQSSGSIQYEFGKQAEFK